MGNDVEAAFTDEKIAEAKQTGDSRPFALAGLAILLGVVGVAVGSAGLAKANSNAADAKGAVAPASAAVGGGGTAAGLVVDNELPAESEFLAGSKTLDEIVSRGKLKCAIVPSPGFAAEDEDGNLYGMDVDMCHAIAAAALGDPDKVEYKMITFAERFSTLADLETDVVGISTHTMERDVYEKNTKQGFTFTVPYFYEGLGFAGVPTFVDCADEVNVQGACADLKICVAAGTTWIDQLSELFPDNIVPTDNVSDGFPKLEDGSCNVLAAEKHDVGLDTARAEGYTGEFKVGANLFSKEPLGMVTRDDDDRWSDIVNWVVHALMAADEQGVTQATAKAIGPFTALGEEFESLFVDVIEAVGSYGEIYQRHMEDVVPRGGLNEINKGASGLIYSHPFGSLQTEAPYVPESSTLAKIRKRGHLKCGVSNIPSFSRFDQELSKWVGFDVDYCRAVSAAIFSGDPNRVVFLFSTSAQRFKDLALGDVDILSRLTTVTLGRDIRETSSQTGFTFTRPTYYDGLTYGGVDEFVVCAENEVTTGNCANLKICVRRATTYADVLHQLFPAANVMEVDPDPVIAVEKLKAGECNVVGAGTIEQEDVKVAGYSISSKTVSKDPLALVTREGDPTFSDFAYWVVNAIQYAEENGIDSTTASEIPTTFLFGPRYENMLIDAVAAVGNHGDIYSRHVESVYPRAGLNNLNEGGPKLYPYPGFSFAMEEGF